MSRTELESTAAFVYSQAAAGGSSSTDTVIPPKMPAGRKLKMEIIGAAIAEELRSQGVTEQDVLADFREWREGRRNDRR